MTMIELPRTLVVVALRAESAGVFEAANVPVLYCGVGKVNAAIALGRELSRYVRQGQAMPLVLNFGSAGSRRHATGTLGGMPRVRTTRYGRERFGLCAGRDSL